MLFSNIITLCEVRASAVEIILSLDNTEELSSPVTFLRALLLWYDPDGSKFGFAKETFKLSNITSASVAGLFASSNMSSTHIVFSSSRWERACLCGP